MGSGNRSSGDRSGRRAGRRPDGARREGGPSRLAAFVVLMSLFATLVHMAAPAPARAAGLDGGSIIHVKDSNVWLISPDGVQRAQVTTDGTTPSPDGKGSSRYSHPSQSDDGQVVVAVRNQQERVIAQRGYLWVMTAVAAWWPSSHHPSSRSSPIRSAGGSRRTRGGS